MKYTTRTLKTVYSFNKTKKIRCLKPDLGFFEKKYLHTVGHYFY